MGNEKDILNKLNLHIANRHALLERNPIAQKKALRELDMISNIIRGIEEPYVFVPRQMHNPTPAPARLPEPIVAPPAPVVDEPEEDGEEEEEEPRPVRKKTQKDQTDGGCRYRYRGRRGKLNEPKA